MELGSKTVAWYIHVVASWSNPISKAGVCGLQTIFFRLDGAPKALPAETLLVTASLLDAGAGAFGSSLQRTVITTLGSDLTILQFRPELDDHLVHGCEEIAFVTFDYGGLRDLVLALHKKVGVDFNEEIEAPERWEIDDDGLKGGLVIRQRFEGAP